ncbi:MAG: DUF1553 domain-containing protein [Planctomycetaceae bacterium]
MTILSAESTEGATLASQADGSYLVEGEKPETDIYRLTGSSSLKQITAVRLEVLPHDSLPNKGPGRAENGNLHLNEVHLLQSNESETKPKALALATPFADFNQEGWEIDKAVDNNPGTAWGIHPAEGKPHFAIFPLTEIASWSDEQTLQIELEQTHGRSHLIGCFRITVTDAPLELLRTQSLIPIELATILRQDFDTRTPEDQAKLLHWVLLHQLETELASLPPQQLVYCGTNNFEKEGSFKPAAEPRDVHVLHRGLVSDPRELASVGALRCLESLPGELVLDTPTNEGVRREALAEWLASKQNPLTWRSIANRVWLYHFGQALVDTPNDFGQMGSFPTHPELLDWLAITLQQQQGSLKALHRIILTSAVYQQSSLSLPQGVEVDAGNQLLWRMNRQRLDAESFRDSLLAISASLDSKMGGLL